MKELKPVQMLKGHWSGKGKGSYGPFTADVDVDERGRWLLMRQEIKVPIVGITSYVSTQVYGFTETGLTLDFFDTAGAFHFEGSRDGDRLQFEWKSARGTKSSTYWRDDDDTLRFHYVSDVREADSDEPRHTSFEGVLEREDD